MMPRLLLLALAALAAAFLSGPPAQAAGPTMALGVAEDAVRGDTLVQARWQLALLRLAGFDAVRITSTWRPGAAAPTAGELAILRNVEAAARLSATRVFLSVYHAGSATTPVTPEAQAQFAAYVAAVVAGAPTLDDVIVGNEPNLNRFWLPQFNPDGTIASAPAYLSLLTQTYDAVKAVDPTARVWGGALSPRGADRPGGVRPTTSPTAFLQALGTAYRATGRALPIMDGLAHHPYPDTNAQPPDTPHPRSTTIALADYDKLVTLLASAFDGTAQPGSTLPILYAEFGIESEIPPGKASVYTGAEPATTKPVSEAAQATSYVRALGMAFCQSNVVGMLLFHSVDEAARSAWQSGVYYADATPKSSFYPVRDALRRARGGSLARCDGLALPVGATPVRFPSPATFAAGDRLVRFTCTLDCRWELRSVRVSDGAVTATTRGFGRARDPRTASLSGRPVGRQPVRFELSLVHPVNPAEPIVRRSAELRPR